MSCVSIIKVLLDVSNLYVQCYLHALAKEYLPLHKPDCHDFQPCMARSTSDIARTNVDYRMSKLIRINRTDSNQTHKHITRLIELAVDDELAVDKVVHVEVADGIQQVSS